MKSIRKSNTVIGIIAIILALCDIASLALLFSRFSGYSRVTFQNVIPLTESNGVTTVTKTTRSKVDRLSVAYSSEPKITPLSYANTESAVIQLANPGFEAYDNDTVWLSETEVEIFHLNYDNESGETTIKTQNGDKLLAPGTSNEYVFTLENTGDVLLDYEMTMAAWITGTELELPVKARVWEYTDKYLLGSEAEKAEVLELNTVSENSKLSAGRFAVYILEWE